MDEEKYIMLYKEMGKNRRDYVDRAWETIKFFTTIYTAILSVTVTLIIYFKPQFTSWPVTILITFLPISAIAITGIGWHNFRREYARTGEIIATLKKLEKLLNFHEEIEESKRYFKNDKYILPEAYVEACPINSTEGFVDYLIRGGNRRYGNFYRTFRWLFVVYIIISIAIIILIPYLH